jgi:hypothetical protein
MPAKRFQGNGDPALKTKQWKAIKAYWQRTRHPTCEADRCLLPGTPIRYDGERGPDSLDVGHKQTRDTDARRIWNIADTRPEHERCNRSAGQAHGKQKKKPPAPPRPRNSQTW